jgi:hypothetical protein
MLQEHSDQFAVCVPSSMTVPIASIIARGSAIVGSAGSSMHVTIDYEGSIYGPSVNVRTYADRARRAYDRQAVKYPTVARSKVLRSDLCQVGWFDPTAGVTLLDDAAEQALASWLGVEVIEEKELRFSGL